MHSATNRRVQPKMTEKGAEKLYRFSAPLLSFCVKKLKSAVKNGHTGTVLEHESVAERGVSEGIGVGCRKDIAAVFEVLMWQTKLSEQCGGHVALVH